MNSQRCSTCQDKHGKKNKKNIDAGGTNDARGDSRKTMPFYGAYIGDILKH